MAKSIIEDVRDNLRTADALYRLIYANIGVYLLILITNSFSKLFTGSNDDIILSLAGKWLAVPANPELLITRPWTLITYMFLHFDFFHILFNLLWLYWMGTILREFLGSMKVFSTYILGGICGALLYIIIFNLSPFFQNAASSSYALGASAGVLAITVAAATLVPNYSIRLILITVPLKYIAGVTVLLDFVNISSSNAGGHIAHIGGAIFGFFYIRQLQKGNDMAGWFNRLMDKIVSKSPRRSTMKVKYKRTISDEDFVASKKSQQERVDEILDKISKSGYGSLTQEEKDILFKSSREN